jgi:hypothetical protein
MSNYNLQKATPLQEHLYQEILKTLKSIIVTQKLADCHKVKLNHVSVCSVQIAAALVVEDHQLKSSLLDHFLPAKSHHKNFKFHRFCETLLVIRKQSHFRSPKERKQ